MDEIHNVLAASWREQRVVFNTLRYLSNELESCRRMLWNHGGPASDQWRRAIGPSLRRRFFASVDSGQRVRATLVPGHRPQPAIERTGGVLTVKGLRRILQTSGGVSARILSACSMKVCDRGHRNWARSGSRTRRWSDYKPVGEDEVAFQADQRPRKRSTDHFAGYPQTGHR